MVFEDGGLFKRLQQTECPAFWGLEKLENKTPSKSMLDKLSEKNEEIAGQSWRYIVLELAMSYECLNRDVPMIPQASQKLQYCISFLNNAEDNSFEKKYEIAFRHLVHSFKAFVALKKEARLEAERCFKEVVELSAMSKKDLAAVYGIKGNVLAEYGNGGTQEAFVWVRKALSLDDTEPEWHFLLGKLHCRWRHFFLLSEASEEEVKSLETAYELLKAPHTAVYLAQNCLERSKLIFYKQPLERGKRIFDNNVELTLRNLNQRALKLYNEAMIMNNDQCLHIMIRCVWGFVTLPPEFQQTGIALKMAHKALERSPENAMLRAALSMIYKCRRDVGGAIINAKISARAGAFGSHIRLMNLYNDFKSDGGTDKKKKEPDIAALIQRALEIFPIDLYRLQLYIYGSNYFLFVKRDLFKSLHYFEEALPLDSQFNLLEDRYVRWVKVHLNLYELMFNEIECAFLKESFVNETEEKMLSRVREKIIAARPDVVNYKIVRDLVHKLKENRFPSSRGRTRTRKNAKKDPKKRKTGNKDLNKRLKSAVPLFAHSRDAHNSKMRSSSDDRAFHHRVNDNNFQRITKRPLSHDGRSVSREDTRKKLLLGLDKLKNSINDLTLEDMRPSLPLNKWSSGAKNLETSLSQMTLETGKTDPKRANGNVFSKRSVSFDRQSQPQKKATPVKLLDDKNVLFAFPSFFKVPSTEASVPAVKYGSLTVANVEKLGNAKTQSSESLDSDDTLNSQMSELSLQQSNAKSGSSVALANKRSVSLDSSRCPVAGRETKKSESLVDLGETEEALSPEVDGQKLSSNVAVGSSKLLIGRGKGNATGSWYQDSLSDRMRDLSIEKVSAKHKVESTRTFAQTADTLRWPNKERSSYERPGNPRHPRSETYDDRRSPFGRNPSTMKVLRPPGFRQRTDSGSSVSSADSDYVASRWSARGYRNRH